ncbi:NAD-dependent epimerase/dehydratase family protein [Nocardioides bruguierae]|uniref:NAD-dependent epimerase/dehydratase family protein n=1 Tax=Nocardioides bruguierae TaxID=2945102 RepID=UPI0020225EB1|nr:NAD-dependent epimerase/dehydratase family protein [Nocardioides bruguierae]MCL8026751.1 NAD-dependent epimerase/dehydratase family protein [Nocardioides bruguierae]
MRVFVTGASGWIASAVVPQLVARGHEVTGLARSEASAAVVEKRGGTALRGDLADHDLLARAAAEHDAVVHLAFDHSDMNDINGAAEREAVAMAALTAALEGSGTPVVAASGTPFGVGHDTTEEDALPSEGPTGARGRNEVSLFATAQRGVRPAVVRLPRSVHGDGDRHGFVPALVGIFREAGRATYVGEGSNRWCAVHVEDAGRVFVAAVEGLASGSVPPASVLHAVAETGVPVKVLAEELGARLGLEAVSVGPEPLGFFGMLQLVDHGTTAERTRELLGWEPTGPTLLEDVAAGVYDA